MKNEQPELSVEPLPDLAALEAQWLELENRSDSSYFTSWGWIGCWLQSLAPDIQPTLLRIRLNALTVGLAILVKRRIFRYGVIPVDAVFVNATGLPRVDAIMIEYNNVLFHAGFGVPNQRTVMKSLMTDFSSEELHVPGVQASTAWLGLEHRGYTCSILERRGHGVDLNEVRGKGDYLTLLSANARRQIRNSLKEFSKLGEIKIEVASNETQADSMYQNLCQLHEQVWRARGQDGAFANSYLREFHWSLIRNRLPAGEIQLISVQAGSTLLGVLYNFVYRGRVYNYQSGFDYSVGSRQSKPGLLVHSLAIRHNAESGHEYYDLMAGDSQYKRTIGTSSNALLWVTYQRDSWKFRAINALREARQSIIGLKAKAWHSAPQPTE